MVWTCFWGDSDKVEASEAQKVRDDQLKLRNVSGKKTIVFDILDYIIKIVDPTKDKLKLVDIKQTYQFYCRSSNKVYLLTVTEKVNRICMEEKLRKMARNYELVIFSVLPKQVVDKILDKLDYVKKYISHVVGSEHCTTHNNFITKDLLLLKEGRTV